MSEAVYCWRSSGARDGHSIYPYRRRRHGPAKLQVISDCRHVLEHLAQVFGYRDLLDRVRQLAVLDPQTRRAARIISRHEVRPESHQASHVEPRLDVTDDLLRCLRSRFEIQI